MAPAPTRMHKTGNIMIELSMSRKTGLYDGWFYKCKADILCYVDAHAGNLPADFKSAVSACYTTPANMILG